MPNRLEIDEKETKKSSGSVAGQLVEVPGPGNLRRQHPLEAPVVELRQQTVVEHHRGVHDPAQRPDLRLNRADQLGDLLLVADIGLHDLDASPQASQRFDRLLCLRTGLAAPREYEGPGAAVRQPAGHREAEASEAAGDEVRAVLPELRAVGGAGGDLDRLVSDGDDDLPDVLGLRHVPQRIRELGARESLSWHRCVGAVLELCEDLLEERADVLRLLGEQTVEVDREVREVLPELEQMQARVLVDVPLADLHEPAGRTQRGEAFADRLAGQ